MSKLTHFDNSGKCIMVEVGHKKETLRSATAKGSVVMNSETFKLVKEGGLAKGDVLGIARVAGIMAAKKTSELIPLCHPIFITKADISFSLDEEATTIGIAATVNSYSKTGVEMEALTAVSAAALTIYDMCKASDKSITIANIFLEEKLGGKSGHYKRPDPQPSPSAKIQSPSK